MVKKKKHKRLASWKVGLKSVQNLYFLSFLFDRAGKFFFVFLLCFMDEFGYNEPLFRGSSHQ